MTDLNAKIIPLHSEVLERVPTVEQVDIGEIAVNIADRKIYTKNSADEIVILGEGAGGGLPGGGFKPATQIGPIYKWTYRDSDTPNPLTGEASHWQAGTYLFLSTTDADGVFRQDELYALDGTVPIRIVNQYRQTIFEGFGLVNNENSARFGLEIRETEGGAPTSIWKDGLADGDEIFIDPSAWTEEDLTELPLKDGDALRYDGEFWRPVDYRLEALDDVVGRSVAAAGSYWLLRVDNSTALTDGEATVNVRVNLHPIDGRGVDRTQDLRDWRDDLLGITGGPGDQDAYAGTLTFVINGVEYPVTVTQLDDDMGDSGANQPAFQIECNFSTLYPAITSGPLELKEFSEFLGLSVTSGFDTVDDGSVLQYSLQNDRWQAGLLNFELDDAANVALRVDAGSGTEIPKAIGDAFLWDGTNWTPSSPLSGSSISALSDVNTVTTSPSDGQALVWDNANGYWKPGTVASDTPDLALNDLTDATVDAPSEGQILKYTSGVWVNSALVYADISDGPTVPQNIGDLGDVDLSLAPVPGQALVWDGTAWKPADQTGGGGSGDTVVGALTERADVSVTESFTTGQTKNVQFSGLGEAGKFVQVTVSFPAWVRFYATAADRDADALREVDEDPIAGSGVLMELRTTTADEVVKITPGAIYYNNDLLPSQTLYARITNEAGSATSITTTVRSYTSTSTDAIDGGTFGSG